MPRYAALLRAVSPTNAKMPDLKRAFEAAGFDDVRTVLATGNVVFGAPEAFSAYDESVPNSPVMSLVEKTFGTEVTTRTWLTVTKVAR